MFATDVWKGAAKLLLACWHEDVFSVVVMERVLSHAVAVGSGAMEISLQSSINHVCRASEEICLFFSISNTAMTCWTPRGMFVMSIEISLRLVAKYVVSSNNLIRFPFSLNSTWRCVDSLGLWTTKDILVEVVVSLLDGLVRMIVGARFFLFFLFARVGSGERMRRRRRRRGRRRRDMSCRDLPPVSVLVWNSRIFEHDDLITQRHLCLSRQEQERDDAHHHIFLGHDHTILFLFLR